MVFEIVNSRSSTLWNEFIALYYYLGYKTLPGAQLRYFIKAEGRILALLDLEAAAFYFLDRLLDDLTNEQTAGRINDEGLPSGKGRPFTRMLVGNI